MSPTRHKSLAIFSTICLFIFSIACGGGGAGGLDFGSPPDSTDLIEIEGLVTDEVIRNARVSLFEAQGSEEISIASTVADSQGNYRLTVPTTGLESSPMLLMRAEGVGDQSHVVLRSILGSGSSLIGRSKAGRLAGKSYNITHVTTARWHLVLREGRGQYPDTEEELSERRGRVVEEVLSLATHIKLVVDNDDFLPNENVEALLFADTLLNFVALVAGPQLAEHLEEMREETINDPNIDWYEDEQDDADDEDESSDDLDTDDDSKDDDLITDTNDDSNNDDTSNDEVVTDTNDNDDDGQGSGNTTNPPVVTQDDLETFSSSDSIGRFLTQATFGPTPNELNELKGKGVSAWIKQQFALSPSLQLPQNLEYERLTNAEAPYGLSFWKHAVSAPDQLRQRVAFALSQIFVVSNASSDLLEDNPDAMANYYDILIKNSFGNYRQILEEVTYSPVMGHYLTYLGSKKADPTTGRQPDENYAREVLQLFSIGLVELNQDGSHKLNASGKESETYTNNDITGLAKVFTGFANHYHKDPDFEEEDPDADDEGFIESWIMPMVIEAVDHSRLSKNFLGTTIPADTDGSTSVTLALDAIFNHPNVGPFIGKQLIQRLVTSNPSPSYISRVGEAFNSGHFGLPDGSSVGSRQRGDLMAVTAAILLDPEARSKNISEKMGKVREPILRFTAWARAFTVTPTRPEIIFDLYNTSDLSSFGQHPLKSPSVFNFYRPGFASPGSLTGAQGMVAPELQIFNASTIPGVINTLEFFVMNEHNSDDVRSEWRELEGEDAPNFDLSNLDTFVPNYSYELSIAHDGEKLIDHLDKLLTYGTMTGSTRASILKALPTLEQNEPESAMERVTIAILMVLGSPDFIVQL